jgi:hypothetical protein
MPRSVLSANRATRLPPIVTEASADGKVVPLRLAVLPRHRTYLLAWLQAGGRMGLCDVDVVNGIDAEVYVWVRENPDPAYAVRAEGMNWIVVDHLRGRKLGVFRSFEAALYCIRPVVPSGIAA